MESNKIFNALEVLRSVEDPQKVLGITQATLTKYIHCLETLTGSKVHSNLSQNVVNKFSQKAVQLVDMSQLSRISRVPGGIFRDSITLTDREGQRDILKRLVKKQQKKGLLRRQKLIKKQKKLDKKQQPELLKKEKEALKRQELTRKQQETIQKSILQLRDYAWYHGTVYLFREYMEHGSIEKLRNAIFNYGRVDDVGADAIILLLEAVKIIRGNAVEFREVYSNKGAQGYQQGESGLMGNSEIEGEYHLSIDWRALDAQRTKYFLYGEEN